KFVDLLLNGFQLFSQVCFLVVQKYIHVANAGVAIACNGGTSPHDADAHSNLPQHKAGFDSADILLELVRMGQYVLAGNRDVLKAQVKGLCAFKTRELKAGARLETI